MLSTSTSTDRHPILVYLEIRHCRPDEAQAYAYRKEVEDEWLSSARSVGPENSSADAGFDTSEPPPYTSRQPRASEKPRAAVRIETPQQRTGTSKAPSRRPRLKDVTHLTFHTWWLEDHESNDLTFRCCLPVPFVTGVHHFCGP